MTNRLALETSPYLLQHADNPVDWYPWGEEALALAQRDDRPILLSIGYSACHWCHVMAHESFEDRETAARMNELFVNVKVDREERPDIDTIYMRAVQSMTGHGGWPLTAFLTPDGLPFYGGTYFPPQARHGMPSFRQVLDAAARAYGDRREEVTRAASELRTLIERSMGSTAMAAGGDVDTPLGPELVASAREQISRGYDPSHGGFGRAPKFPQSVVLELMLRPSAVDPDADARDMAVHTLRKMAGGGMHDQLAGGFHRYSVDALWLVPHFEKMLYDNALLARAYLQAHLATGSPDLREIAEKTLDYVLADLRAPEGGFYSARDADSEGEEGLFYVWRPEEIEALLEPRDARLFRRVYAVTESGNFEGRNILHVPHDLATVARAEGIDLADLRVILERAGARLLAARQEREPPFRDEKILVAWNGFAIRALAEAGAAFERQDYLDAAEAAARFVMAELWPAGGLLRSFKERPSGIRAFLEDHAALGNALLSLHEATLDPEWARLALVLAEKAIELFWVDDEGVFYDTPSDGAALVVRPREVTDNATPSGNSLVTELLLRLARLLDRDDLRGIAERVLAREASSMERFPSAFGRLLSVLDAYLDPGPEVVIVGDPERADTRALLAVVHATYLPDRIVTGGGPERPPFDSPLFEGRTLRDGRATAYVCRGYACREPVTDALALQSQLVSGQP